MNQLLIQSFLHHIENNNVVEAYNVYAQWIAHEPNKLMYWKTAGTQETVHTFETAESPYGLRSMLRHIYNDEETVENVESKMSSYLGNHPQKWTSNDLFYQQFPSVIAKKIQNKNRKKLKAVKNLKNQSIANKTPEVSVDCTGVTKNSLSQIASDICAMLELNATSIKYSADGSWEVQK